MPPRKTRAAKKADEHGDAPSKDIPNEESSSTAPDNIAEGGQQEQESAASSSSPASTMAAAKSKSKARAARHQPLLPEEPSNTSAASATEAEPEPEAEPEAAELAKPSMEERQARLSALRAKMAASTKANRQAILSEQSRARAIASELKHAGGSRKLVKAEKVLEERDLREAGEDVERHRNLQYSLEESEAWDAKLEEKERRKDRGPADFGDAAERAYQRQLHSIKPDVGAYNQQRAEREKALANSPASSALAVRGKGRGKARAGDEATDEIHYGSHTPSDDAIDRVVNHLNHEKQLIQNRSRRRNEDPDAEVNYINDSNRHFNKKLKRYYDKQTQEIRENRKSDPPLSLGIATAMVTTTQCAHLNHSIISLTHLAFRPPLRPLLPCPQSSEERRSKLRSSCCTTKVHRLARFVPASCNRL